MALDGTLAVPRQLLVVDVAPIGFYFTGTDGTTGLALTDAQLLALTPFVCLKPKARPQVEPALAEWVAATWHRGKKGLRADIEWGVDFLPTAGVTYVGFGRVVGVVDKPARIFGYFKAI